MSQPFHTFSLDPVPGWEDIIADDRELPMGAKSVCLLLARCLGGMAQFAWPGEDWLRERIVGSTEKMIKAALGQAKEAGYLKTYRDFARGLIIYVPSLPPGKQVLAPRPPASPAMTLVCSEDLTWKLVALALSDRKCEHCGKPNDLVDRVLNVISKD